MQYRLNQPSGGSVEPLEGSSGDEVSACLSPDGKLLAYRSDEAGRFELYVREFAGHGSRVQVSTAGGGSADWSKDGKRLFFLDRQNVLYAVDVDTTNGLKVSAPMKLFDTTTVATTTLWGVFDALPDGSFVMVEPAAWEREPPRIQVVLNWSEEVRRLTAANAKSER